MALSGAMDEYTGKNIKLLSSVLLVKGKNKNKEIHNHHGVDFQQHNMNSQNDD